MTSSRWDPIGTSAKRFRTQQWTNYQITHELCVNSFAMSVADPDPPLLHSRPARARLFAALADLKTPTTTADLAARLGLHVNGVRRHLERLQQEGLVARERVRGHRGRPRDLWSVRADVGPGPFEANEPYVDLARWLAIAIPSRPGRADEIHEAGRRIGHELAPEEAEHPGHAFVEVLRKLGFRPFAEERDGERVLCRLGRCPYAKSVKENPQIICTLHRGISEGILERLDPHARLTRFVARDPDEAGCELEVQGLTLE